MELLLQNWLSHREYLKAFEYQDLERIIFSGYENEHHLILKAATFPYKQKLLDVYNFLKTLGPYISIIHPSCFGVNVCASKIFSPGCERGRW